MKIHVFRKFAILAMSFLLSHSFLTFVNLASYSNSNNATLGQLAWSPDGTMLSLIAGTDILIIDAQDDKLELQFKHPFEITTLSWSLNSQRLATGSSDQTIRLWDIQTGNLVFELKGKEQIVSSIVWSPDDKLIYANLITPNDEAYTIYVWDAKDGKLLSTYPGGTFTNSALNPKGDQIAMVSFSGGNFRDINTLEIINRFYDTTYANDFSYTFSWSPDSKFIAVGGSSGKVYLWDATQTSTEPLAIFEGVSSPTLEITEQMYPQLNWVREIAFTPDGNYILVVKADGTLWMWEVSTQQLVSQGQISVNSNAIWSPYAGRIAYLALDQQNLLVKPSVENIQISSSVASLDLLKSIAQGCQVDQVLETQSIGMISNDTIADFITQVETLPEGAIPSACAADLIAVTEAILAQP